MIHVFLFNRFPAVHLFLLFFQVLSFQVSREAILVAKSMVVVNIYYLVKK